MYVLPQLKKKGQARSERTGKQTTAAQLWQMASDRRAAGRREDAQSQAGAGDGRAPAWFPPQNPPEGKEACFWNEGWDSLHGGVGRAGREELHLHPHLPFPNAGDLPPHTFAEIWRFTSWKM